MKMCTIGRCENEIENIILHRIFKLNYYVTNSILFSLKKFYRTAIISILPCRSLDCSGPCGLYSHATIACRTDHRIGCIFPK